MGHASGHLAPKAQNPLCAEPLPRGTRPQAPPLPFRPRGARRILLLPLFTPPRNPTPNAPMPLAHPRNPTGSPPKRFRRRAMAQNQRFDPLSAAAEYAQKPPDASSAPAQLPKHRFQAHSALDGT